MDAPRPAEPRWIGPALRASIHELEAFFRTAVAFALRPSRFAEEWVRGESTALNPLAFLATSATLLSAFRLALPMGSQTSLGLALTLQDAVAPYGYFALVALVCHLILGRDSGRRLTSSIAIALFAGGGPAAAATGVNLFIGALVDRPKGVGFLRALPLPLAILAGLVTAASFLAFLVTFGYGLAGLHGTRRRRAVLAVLVALVSVGIVLGWLHVPLGVLHLEVAVHETSSGGYRLDPDLWF